MARQNGQIKVKGTIGDLTFLETADGHRVRKKRREISKDRLLNADEYERVRENWSEFRRAAAASKMFRRAALPSTLMCKDNRVTSRLTKTMLAIAKSDPVSTRGMRTVTEGNLGLLKGFDFNAAALSTMIMKFPRTVSFDPAEGKITITIPEFVPKSKILSPGGVIHFKIHSMGLEFNFDEDTYVAKYFESDGFLHDNTPVPAINIEHQLTPGSGNPMIALLGIRFYDFVNGIYYPFQSHSYNALTIVHAERP